MTFPDRFSPLIARLEAGQPVTDSDVHRLAQLQALDIARIGEDFARDAIAREEQQTEAVRKAWEERCQP